MIRNSKENEDRVLRKRHQHKKIQKKLPTMRRRRKKKKMMMTIRFLNTPGRLRKVGKEKEMTVPVQR